MKSIARPAVLVAFAVVSLTLGWRVFQMRPFLGDNVRILEWAERTPLSAVPRANPTAYPEWRPLPYATVWLQYRLASFEHLSQYYVVNVLLWAACAWLVFRIVQLLTKSIAAGVAAGLIVLTSTQLVPSFVLIEERQSALACLFGLAAWLMLVSQRLHPPSRWWLSGLALLLAGSSLSKEYGLAFSAAVFLFAVAERWRAGAAAAIAAIALYGTLRIVFAGGALAPYCEEHGYFFASRSVCFDRLDVTVVSQVAYNLAATVAGSLLPGLFFDDGTISISPRWLLFSLMFLGIAVLGWIKGPRTNRIGLLLIGCNAALSFLLYRSRNHAIAVCALAVAVGVGLPIAGELMRRTVPSPSVRAITAAILVAILATRMIVMQRLVSERVALWSVSDPCGPDTPDLSRAYMERVWQHYGLSLPSCAGIDDGH